MTKTEPREWQEFTQKAMDLAGLNQIDLARLLAKKLGREFNQSSVRSRIITPQGKAPKDPAELDAWADCLKLDGQHRERFMRLAVLERTPPDIRSRLFELEDNLDKALKKLKAEQRRSAELREIAEKLRAELTKVTVMTTSLMQRLEQK